MVDEKETTNGDDCSMGPKTEAESNDKGGLLPDGSKDGTFSEGLRIYSRIKRRKISNSDDKKSEDNVERRDDSSTPEKSEGSTSSVLCGGALSDILKSDDYSELCGLLVKNFGVENVNRVLGIDAICSKTNNGAYETSPTLYDRDIQQVWTKLLNVGTKMVTLAKSLSYKSRAAEPRGCQGCGEKADVRNCLVCDSCEDIYHLSCTELVGTQIPPLNWYCASCVSKGLGSPHDNCIVCEKLNASAPIPLVNGVSTNDQSQDVPNGSGEHLHDVTGENPSSNICFICKSEVNIEDSFRTCGHPVCPHKFYHYKCLSRKQLGVSGPCWYCPSCLCTRCLVDKDDDQIVICDGCDDAYHIYCASPQLPSIPKGDWFCGKCDRELKRLRTMRKKYEIMQKKVKIGDGSEMSENEEAMNEREGLDILLSAAYIL